MMIRYLGCEFDIRFEAALVARAQVLMEYEAPRLEVTESYLTRYIPLMCSGDVCCFL